MAGCGGEKPAPASIDTSPPWPEFVASTITAYYEWNPGSAVIAGLHEYDSRMADYSLSALDEYAKWLDSVIAEAAAYKDLAGIEAFERDYLLTAMNGRLFRLRDSGYPTTNPRFYNVNVSVGVYVDRDYAPLDKRIATYTRYIAQLPGRMATMKKNLKPPLPAPYLEISSRILRGFAGYLETTVPEVFAPVEDEQLQRRFAAANNEAVSAVRQSAAWLNDLKATATDDYALGEERFLKMLLTTQGVDITLAELTAAGERDLRRNLDALDAVCAEYASGESTRDCVQRVDNRKPAEGAVAGATRQLSDLKQFLIDNEIVSIPDSEEALVAESPPHRRFNAAYISIPGPFESGLPSVYYIAPPDPNWSEEDKLAYIPGEARLLGISVHEVWPGHYLQRLHSRRVENNIGRYFRTSAFSEGWAHYAEQMMCDAGLGKGDPEVRIGQLLNALKRNVRYLSAIGLHTGGMTLAESQQMFAEQAFLDVGNANQQALRGTYDPGYLNYTLGKLMINKLRDDWTASRGGRAAWRQFHDELLSYGSPPIPLLRAQMLGADYDGDRALLPR
jgi:hypothetical protein